MDLTMNDVVQTSVALTPQPQYFRPAQNRSTPFLSSFTFEIAITGISAIRCSLSSTLRHDLR